MLVGDSVPSEDLAVVLVDWSGVVLFVDFVRCAGVVLMVLGRFEKDKYHPLKLSGVTKLSERVVAVKFLRLGQHHVLAEQEGGMN
jgi:hypothetical protein